MADSDLPTRNDDDAYLPPSSNMDWVNGLVVERDALRAKVLELEARIESIESGPSWEDE